MAQYAKNFWHHCNYCVTVEDPFFLMDLHGKIDFCGLILDFSEFIT